MQTRRAIALGVILVLLILIVVGIKSCQNSAHQSALRSYNENVASIIQQSDGTGANLFSILSKGGGSSNAAALQTQINQAGADAGNQLTKAQGLDVPDEMRAAQADLLRALQMRHDGIGDVGSNIQQALGTSTNRDALSAIAADMARFYASDVLYTDYTAPEIAAALHGAGISVGGQNGEIIAAGQFLPSLSWLTPGYIAGRIGAHAPATPGGKPAPGLHGHSLDSVSVNGTTLQSGSTNSIPRSPAPAFTVHFTNSGTNIESNVVVKVVVNGTSAQGQTVVPQTTPGQSGSAQVTLSSLPPAGTYTLTATVQPVPGEKNTANNSQSYPVTFG